MAATTDAEALDKPTPIESLGVAVRVFFKYPSPLMIFGAAIASTIARLSWGMFSWWDLGVVVAIAAFWPVQEWLIHVFILHFRPKRFLGRSLDLHVAREHRKHHREPWVLPLVFVPWRVVVVGILAGVPLYLAAWHLIGLPMSVGLTGLATYWIFGSIYEWTHFLVHTAYRPKSAFYKRLWKHHRFHHFKNENYWWGVSRIEGDWLLGTSPEPGDVPKSTSVREIVGDLGE